MFSSSKKPFSDGNIANTLNTVTDGQAALDFINQQGEYEDAPDTMSIVK